MTNDKVEQLVETAWKWQEEIGTETQILEATGLRQQNESVEFLNSNMSLRRSNRFKGDDSPSLEEHDEDSQMTETRTSVAGSKRTQESSSTPLRNKLKQMPKLDDLPLDAHMQEGPANVTPMGPSTAGTPVDEALRMSDDNFPPLSPLRNPDADNTKPAHLKEPPTVTRVPEQPQHTPATDESTPNVEKATPSEAQQQHATASAETESMQKPPQKSNVEAQEETLSKQVQAMQVQESKSLQMILTAITYSPLWQVIMQNQENIGQ